MEEKKSSFTPIKTEPLILDDQSQEKTESSVIIDRFFKVLTPDFHTILRLPPAFCKKLKAESTPDRAVLTSRKGTWTVKIGGCMNGKQVCFEDGWGEFAEAHDLGVGDIVVFEHQSNMEFKVLVYDSSCCENDFSAPEMENEDEEKEAEEKEAEAQAEEKEAEAEEGADFGREIYERANRKIRRGRPRNMNSLSLQERRQFTVKFNKRSPFDIPKAFWKLNKLEGARKVLLIGPSGESYEVTLMWNPGNYTLRFNRSRGWVEFCGSNSLKDGDICTFQLSCDDHPSTSVSPMIKLNVQVIPAPNL